MLVFLLVNITISVVLVIAILVCHVHLNVTRFLMTVRMAVHVSKTVSMAVRIVMAVFANVKIVILTLIISNARERSKRLNLYKLI